jgi:hypothetical protein
VLTDQVGWAWIALIAAMAFATLIQLSLPRAPEYGLTVSWALIAVALRNLESLQGLAALALAGAVAIGFLALRPSILKS